MKILDAFFGFAVGDALGVPVEFLSRETIRKLPVTDMWAFGTHNQPAGTWSDDSSLAFCLAESLATKGYDLEDIAKNFILWYNEDFWTAHGKVFDIGIGTAQALRRVEEHLQNGQSPTFAGGNSERDNGNGSLMRILPIVFYLKAHQKTIEQRFKIISDVSSITHGHIRSILACFIYCEFALELLEGHQTQVNKEIAYKNMQDKVNNFLNNNTIASQEEIDKFHRILGNGIIVYGENLHISILDAFEDKILSSGYVLDTLEASIWCFMTTNSYADATLKAVNLGSDTDTTGCVTGGLAGLYYGKSAILAHWVDVLAKKDEIIDLAERLDRKLSK